MNEKLSVIDEMDEAILKATGGKPLEYDLQGLFNECQTYQQHLYGGGELNRAESEYIEAVKRRETEVNDRRNQLIAETEEVEELEVEEARVEEPDDLVRDGIIIRR